MTMGQMIRQYTVRLLVTHAMGNIHGDVLSKIMRAPINLFFEVTPTGLIVSRFNEDMGKFGDTVHFITWGLYMATQLLMTLYAISLTNPLALLCVPVLMGYT